MRKISDLRFLQLTAAVKQLAADGMQRLQAFSRAGGEVLFGTAMGCMRVYEPSGERAQWTGVVEAAKIKLDQQ